MPFAPAVFCVSAESSWSDSTPLTPLGGECPLPCVIYCRRRRFPFGITGEPATFRRHLLQRPQHSGPASRMENPSNPAARSVAPAPAYRTDTFDRQTPRIRSARSPQAMARRMRHSQSPAPFAAGHYWRWRRTSLVAPASGAQHGVVAWSRSSRHRLRVWRGECRMASCPLLACALSTARAVRNRFASRVYSTETRCAPRRERASARYHRIVRRGQELCPPGWHRHSNRRTVFRWRSTSTFTALAIHGRESRPNRVQGDSASITPR